MRLEGRAAMVTGAGRGIGRCIALALADEGASVGLAARTTAQLETVRGEIAAGGGTAACFPGDMADAEAVVALVRDFVAWAGRLDIAVNNAAAGLFGPLEETDAADWDRVMAVNARGPFLLCREALPHLRAAGGGHIVNIASVVGIKGYAGQSAYTASKHALMGMSKSLAREVQDEGIFVHAICPGGVNTGLISAARPDLDPAELIDPADVAGAVVFMVTREGNCVIDQLTIRRSSSKPFG